MPDPKPAADSSADGANPYWRRYVDSAIGGIPSADPILTHRHELLEEALNGEESVDDDFELIWDGTYQTGELFESFQDALLEAGSTVTERPTTDIPTAVKPKTPAKKQGS